MKFIKYLNLGSKPRILQLLALHRNCSGQRYLSYGFPDKGQPQAADKNSRHFSLPITSVSHKNF